MIEIIWPTLVMAGLAVVCGLLWIMIPRLQRNDSLRVGLIVFVLGTVGLGLIAAVEIVGRIMAFGLADAF